MAIVGTLFIKHFKYERASDLILFRCIENKSCGEIVPRDDETDDEIDSIRRMKSKELDQSRYTCIHNANYDMKAMNALYNRAIIHFGA